MPALKVPAGKVHCCPDCACAHGPRYGKRECPDCGCGHPRRNFILITEEEYNEIY